MKKGTWPEHCEQRAFVDGAAWWQFKRGATAFPSEREEMEAEAVRRYGEPLDYALDSPDSVPQQQRDFAARGYERINRDAPAPGMGKEQREAVEYLRRYPPPVWEHNHECGLQPGACEANCGPEVALPEPSKEAMAIVSGLGFYHGGHDPDVPCEWPCELHRLASEITAYAEREKERGRLFAGDLDA